MGIKLQRISNPIYDDKLTSMLSSIFNFAHLNVKAHSFKAQKNASERESVLFLGKGA